MPTSLLAGRYRIERVIGEGAFGRVYLAFDTRLRRNVAVKELLAIREQTDRETYDRYVERFQREARATGTIQHPNVVTAYDLHVDAEGNNYLVMEYVDGTNLRDLLAQVGTLPEARALAIATDVARALEAVHEQEIVHRDVKPANIMITRRGVAKLMDFGIARIAHEQQLTMTTGSHPGTPLYMSPEQSAGYGYIDGRSDLYSLGLVLYEMLVGEPYARKRQPIGTVRTSLASQTVAVVERLTARDADARYQSAAAVATDLQAITPAAPAAPDAYAPPPDTATRIGPPPTPAGGVVGVPSAYGGPATPQPPGAPAYQSGAPPSVTGTGGFPPPAYPAAPLYGAAPPPVGPLPKSHRGLLFGLGGGLLAVLAVIGIALFATRGGSNTTATATPGSSAGVATVTALSVTIGPATTATATSGATATTVSSTVTATRAATPTTSVASATPAVTPTRPPTTPTTASTPARTATVGATGQLTNWAEPNGLLSLKYPSGWTQTRDSSDNTNLVEIDGPNGPYIYVYLNDPQQGAIQDEINIIVKNQGTSTKYTYTDQKIADAQVGGQPGKILTYTYTDKTDAAKVFSGIWWVVNNGGKQFSILAGPIGNSRADVDALVGSVTFANAKTTSFTDPDGIIKLQYPTEWILTKDATDKTNLLSLSGVNDEVHIFLYVYPPGSETYDQTFKKIRDSDSDTSTTVRVYDPVLDTKVGGQAAKSLAYKYSQKDKPNLQPGVATIWLVDHNGKRYEFRCSNIALHRAEIEAVMNSVNFVK